MKKVVSIFLAFLFVCVIPLPNVSASTTTNSNVYSSDEMSDAAKEFIADFGIPINENSMFVLSTTTGVSRSSVDTASVQVVTQNGDQTTISVLSSFTTDKDATTPDAKLADLFTQTNARNGSSYSYINSDIGFKIVGTCVYTSYTSGGYTYLHLTSEYFTYYDQGGTAPSKIRHVSACTGKLYTKSGTTMTFVQNDYRHAIDYTKTSPASNTMYSCTNEMGTNKYILPQAALGGLAMGFFVTVSGTTYTEENSITYY